MRTLKIFVVLLLAVAGLAGCGLLGQDSGPSEDEQIQKILDENAMFTVFLDSEATEAQRRDVEAFLRALPGFTGLTFTDHDGAYEKFKQVFSAPPDSTLPIGPEALPESFEVRMTDIAAVRKVRDEGVVKNLPGVRDVVVACTTVQECREKYSPRPTAPPS
ncbi:permease-like cell division protein FtsX [Actinoplanes sp. NBC_00393]|uniref:permease-like cell division protein FtsX n=1 Tax=Actinoplanes sp. NBC_00393 TaxID=2975953 RepID=UPI002E22BD15